MQIKADLKFSVLLALFVHGCVLFLFTFTFSAPKISVRPVFVFLGSFLRQQDVLLLSLVPSEAHAGLDIRTLNLDSSRGAWSNGVQKPSLMHKAMPQEKNQFKPVVAQPIVSSQSKKLDAHDDLGIEFEPLPPVKLKMNRND